MKKNNINKNISQVECPVCNKKLKDTFALNGHLRLMKDSTHEVYRQSKKIDLETRNESEAHSTSLNGIKLIDRLAIVIEEYEKQNQDENEKDTFIEKLRTMVIEERQNDDAILQDGYQEGCDDTSKEYEAGLDEWERKLIDKYKQEKAALKAEYDQKILEFKVKKEQEIDQIKTTYNQKIENIHREVRSEFSTEYFNYFTKYTFSFLCSFCNTTCYVESNSLLYYEITCLIRQAQLGHLKCMRRYTPNNA